VLWPSAQRRLGATHSGFKWDLRMPVGHLMSARTLVCACCHASVLVCPVCDRAQRYCTKQCSKQAHLACQRRASKKYQRTRAGSIKHARRQQRYRERERERQNEIVTHQCSQDPSVSDVLAPELEVVQGPVCQGLPKWHCHWCARSVASVVRRGWLRHATIEEPVIHGMKADPHGQSP
jgi:hypothetical protein